MATKRTLINVNYSLQRVEHGEQAPWLAVTLAAMLGQIGLPGGGFGQGYGSLGYIGRAPLRVGPPTLPQGRNPVGAFIPFARVADMLLQPGEPFDFDGRRLTYPDIRLVYWCGGNPFHHHQHLARLRAALARPETIVVHEAFWTPMARHADIVLPATMTLERNDIGGSPNDGCLVAMRQAVPPWGEARSDFAIFADLAARLEAGERFSEGRDEMQWLRHLYEGWRARVADDGEPAPPFEAFWAAGFLELSGADEDLVLLKQFRADPEGAPRHAERQDRDLLGDHRRVRLRGLPRTPDLARALGVARRAAGPALPAAPDRQQSDVAPAQPARRRRLQPVDQGARARTDPPAPGRRGRARRTQRRRRPRVQRPGQLPGRRRRE